MTTYNVQDRAGHIWAEVWSTSLGLGLGCAIAWKLADRAQQAFLESIN